MIKKFLKLPLLLLLLSRHHATSASPTFPIDPMALGPLEDIDDIELNTPLLEEHDAILEDLTDPTEFTQENPSDMTGIEQEIADSFHEQDEFLQDVGYLERELALHHCQTTKLFNEFKHFPLLEHNNSTDLFTPELEHQVRGNYCQVFEHVLKSPYGQLNPLPIDFNKFINTHPRLAYEWRDPAISPSANFQNGLVLKTLLLHIQERLFDIPREFWKSIEPAMRHLSTGNAIYIWLSAARMYLREMQVEKREEERKVENVAEFLL